MIEKRVKGVGEGSIIQPSSSETFGVNEKTKVKHRKTID